MRAFPLACLATLLAACSGNVRDTVPTGAAAGAPAPIDVPDVAHPQGETAAWWYRSGAARAAANGAMQGKAKNVIVFLGDGMSLTTVA
ncbi:MAG: alkaline phosphatase, partial [Luteimonas sp.]|nr:alkaline phosphatase [Luteimonas sp.]